MRRRLKQVLRWETMKKNRRFGLHNEDSATKKIVRRRFTGVLAFRFLDPTWNNVRIEQH